MFILLILSLLSAGPLVESEIKLEPGQAVEDVIKNTDSVIVCDALKETSERHPVLGKRFIVKGLEPGFYTLRMRSLYFNSCLLLCDEEGQNIDSDDNGFYSVHSQLVFENESIEAVFIVQACAIGGGRGPFELTLLKGEIRQPAPEIRMERVLEDATEVERIARDRKAIDDVILGRVLYQQGYAFYQTSQYEPARSYLSRAFEIRSKSLGPEDPDLIDNMRDLAIANHSVGKYAEAKEMYLRTISSLEKANGEENKVLAHSVFCLAMLHHALGEFYDARQCFERALRIQTEILGTEHPDTIKTMNGLSRLLKSMGKLAEAIPYCEKTLEISEKVSGPEHKDTAKCINNLATMYYDIGRYIKAKELFHRTLEIREKVLGHDHYQTALTLNDLAGVHQIQGNYAEAKPLYERALKIFERAHGSDHINIANLLNNLALLSKKHGNYEQAREYYQRSVDLIIPEWGLKNPKTHNCFSNLAGLHKMLGNLSEARRMYEELIDVQEDALGSDHPLTAETYSKLASVLKAQKEFPEAEEIYRHAYDQMKETLSETHPKALACLFSMGVLYHTWNRFEEAEDIYLKVRAISLETNREDVPLTSMCMNSLALLYFDMGKLDVAWKTALESVTLAAHQQHRLFWSLTEHERILFAKQKRNALDSLLSLAQALNTPEATQTAYEVLLQWKGRVSQSLLSSRDLMIRNTTPEVESLLSRLKEKKSAYSNELYSTQIDDLTMRRERLQRLNDENDKLEEELYRLIGNIRDDDDIVTVAALQDALGERGALLDFYVHRIYEPASQTETGHKKSGAWSAPRLSAWVMRKGYDAVMHLDLGSADRVRQSVQAYLDETADVKPIADGSEDLDRGDVASPYELIWKPVETLLGKSAVIHVSPDDFLGAFSLDTIRTNKGDYLIERHAFSYLLNLASLARTGESRTKSEVGEEPSLLLVGVVDYNQRADLVWDDDTKDPKIDGSSDDVNLLAFSGGVRGGGNAWRPLRGTDQELRAIKGLFQSFFTDDAKCLELDGWEATEERVEAELPHYSGVHIATHGFFNPEWLPSLLEKLNPRSKDELEKPTSMKMRLGLLPGFLSGLVLAGSNAPAEEGRDDGLLTAEEILWLDLSHVDLAVLSACETGLGSPTSGEGLLGLGRSLRQAGVKQVITSLWKVDDRATSLFFTAFYRYLWKDRLPAAEALRRVKLDMIHGGLTATGDGADRGLVTKPKKRATDYSVPYFWGAFVYYGIP